MSNDLRPENRPASAGRLAVFVLVLTAAIATAAGLLLLAREESSHEAHRPAAFLEAALGEPRADGPLEGDAGLLQARVASDRLHVEGPRGERVALQPVIEGAGAWQRRATGNWRST